MKSVAVRHQSALCMALTTFFLSKVLTLQSNGLLGQDHAEAPSKEDVLKTLGKVSRRLREKLGEFVASIQQFGRPLEEATTASLEALKMLTLGDVQFSGREDLASILLYKRAIELNPQLRHCIRTLGYCSSKSRRDRVGT
jgi:hypothetical protein